MVQRKQRRAISGGDRSVGSRLSYVVGGNECTSIAFLGGNLTTSTKILYRHDLDPIILLGIILQK